jgi:drug/metabolite transporter (DMT)-like permease
MLVLSESWTPTEFVGAALLVMGLALSTRHWAVAETSASREISSAIVRGPTG